MILADYKKILQIYLLKEDYDSHSPISAREQESSHSSRMWIRPIDGSTSSYASFNDHVISNPSSVAKMGPR
jgi:hypothetical protein